MNKINIQNPNLIFSSIFFIFILIISINTFVKIIPDSEFNENRNKYSCKNLINFNNFSYNNIITELKSLPLSVENCINDRIALRNKILNISNSISIGLLNSVKNNNFSKEKDDWFFRTDAQYNNIYTGQLQYDESGKNGVKDYLNTRSSYYKNNNIDYILMIVPFKNAVYPEYQQENRKIYNTKTLVNTFEDYAKTIEEQNHFKFFNLKPDILKQKETQQVFFSNDSHWNYVGASLAYNKIQKYLDQNQTTNNTKILPITAFEKSVYDHTGDIPKILKIPEMYIQNNQIKYTIKNPKSKLIKEDLQYKTPNGTNILYRKYINENKNLPKLVLFGDSFTDILQPLLAESFSEINYYKEFFDIPKSDLEKIKPDLVISLFNEGYLSDIK